MQGMKAHAAAHGFEMGERDPLYHHVRFMLRHPDWTIESQKREVERAAQKVEGYEYVRTDTPSPSTGGTR